MLGELQSWQAAFIVVGLPGLLVAALMIGVREPARRELSDQGSRVSDTLAFFRANAAVLVTIILAFGAVYGVILLACGSGGIFVGRWGAKRNASTERPAEQEARQNQSLIRRFAKYASVPTPIHKATEPWVFPAFRSFTTSVGCEEP